MAITMQVDGLVELGEMLQKMGDEAPKAASLGLYEGAGVMANEIKGQAAGINAEKFHYAVFITRQPSFEEKEVVQQGVGIAKFDKNGAEVNTSVGYANAGYAMIAGKMKPIPQIANAINSGTSFMNKQPFVRKAAASGGAKASAQIVQKIEEVFDSMTK